MKTSWQDEITTGKILGWVEYTPFYHLTPMSRLSSIMAEGLKLPGDVEQSLSKYIYDPKLVPGIYLEEDDVVLLGSIAKLARERGYIEPLSMLRVMVKDTMRFVYDPDMSLGAIVVLEAIPKELITIEVQQVTEEMIREAM